MDGKEELLASRDVLVSRLRHYRDRMLQADWRNRSIFLRRMDRRHTLDLGRLFGGEVKRLDDALRKAVWTRSDLPLVKDSERGEDAERVRSNAVALERTSRTINEETGLSDTYLGFPFIVGRACAEGYVRAPALLFPLEFRRVRSEGVPGWFLAFKDEEPVVNRALVAALRKLCGISLPDDLPEKVQDILDNAPREGLSDHLMQQLQSLLSQYLELEPLGPLERVPSVNDLTSVDVNGLTDIGLRLMPFAVAGVFPQGSTAIFQDYERLIERVQTGQVDLGVLDDLLEADALRSNVPSPPMIDIDSTPDRELNTVLPSDSSQDQVLLEAQRAEAVVVRGPPGTGKSQVITNLIANALSKGERVLVVCQKRAALDVVQQRLGRVGLSDAAVILHDARADRAALYASLSRRMSGEPPRMDEQLERRFQEVSSEIDALVAELNATVKPLWAEMPNGSRPRDLYLRSAPGYVPRMDLGPLPSRLTMGALGALLRKLPGLQVGAWRFDRPAHPWHARIPFTHLDVSARFAMDSALSQASAACLPGALVLGSVQEQDAALSSIDDHLALEGKPLKSINPRWRSASKFLAALQASRPGDPRVSTAQGARRSLASGMELRRALEPVLAWLSPSGRQELIGLALRPDELRSRLDAMRQSLVDLDLMQEHDRALASLSQVEREAHHLCSTRLPADGEPWARTLEQEVVLRWISEFEASNPRMSGDPASRYRDLSVRLGKLLEERRELLRRRLVWRTLDACRRRRLPPGEHAPGRKADTEWNKLIDELSKKRRIKPVRKLMELHQFQLMTAAPVWLASPEAASEVFPLQRGMFDLVVFDESSQLAVERALPSLYRGRRALVAGDEKQLRPFDLFQTRDEDEELDDVTEAESLLVLGMRILTPRYLSWHYRSKYQELIDFSNHAFYDGNLEIAANVQRRFDSAPIDFVRVDGRWEERRNPVEAEKVVDVSHWLLSEGEQKGRMPSVGVITFNEQQRDLVEETIERRRSSDPEFERLYSLSSAPTRNLDDRPFVKNIENVQGDERDAIIFSVAYAKDPSGKMRVQFGPLNREGGENRLNVAITRARERVVMVASFDPAELPVEESKNLGPKRLKDYLLYAQAVSRMRREDVEAALKRLGTAGQAMGTTAQEAGALESMVREALRAQGLEVEERVGFSGYKLDLAVVDPNDPSRYILGIEGDGLAFQTARSARERDVVRPQYLRDRGWAVDRMWSRGWWKDRGGETQRLVGRALALSEEAKLRPKTAPGTPAAKGAPSPDDRRDRPPMGAPKELPYDVPAQAREDGAMRLVFQAQLERWSEADARAAGSILAACEEEGMRLWWNEYRGLSTVTPYLEHAGRAHYFFSLRADGAMDLHFQHMGAPFETSARRGDLLQRLNEVPRMGIPEEYADKWRTVMLERLRTDPALEAFLRAVRWYLNEVRRS